LSTNQPIGTGTALGPSTHADADPAVGQISVPLGLSTGNFLVDPVTSAFNLGGGAESATVDLLLFVESTAASTLEAMVTATDQTMGLNPTQIIADIGGFSDSAITSRPPWMPATVSSLSRSGATAGPVPLGGGAFNTTLTPWVLGAILFPFRRGSRLPRVALVRLPVLMPRPRPCPNPRPYCLWAVASGVVSA